MKAVYELKELKHSSHPDLISALKLYTAYTEPAYRTDTKEIVHCLNVWNKTYEDSFHVLGFYLNNEIIGFSELAYFVTEKFVIVDYIVIDKNNRGNHTFFLLIEEIKNFLARLRYEYNYIVAEVGCYNEQIEPPESSKLLIRLLKIAHFGVVKCNYYVPRVGNYDYESKMRAIMMIYSLNEVKQIKKETFLQIVNAIYFKYYQRWHNIFVDEIEKNNYENELHELISNIKKNLETKKFIEINGLSGLFPINLTPEIVSRGKKLTKLVSGVVVFSCSFLLVATIFALLKNNFGWDTTTATAILLGSIGLTLFLMAWFFENKTNLFSKTLEKLVDRF